VVRLIIVARCPRLKVYDITYLRDEPRSYLTEAEGFNPQWRR